MNYKPVLAMMAAFLLGSTPTAAKEPFSAPSDAIVRIQCGPAVGTATHIGGGLYTSANHVTTYGECKVNGEVVADIRGNEKNDFSTFRGPVLPRHIKVSCKGFTDGETYKAVGYAFARTETMTFPWIATAVPDPAGIFKTFVGEAIPGMSGGPVIDRYGRITGTVNMRWPTRSLPLKETTVCRSR